jgi:acetate kinase
MKNNSGILDLNSGSTSLKFALYAYSDDVLNVVAQGGFSGMPEHTVLVINDANGHKLLGIELF